MTRADVIERFEAAAREMLALNDTYVACVSAALVDEQTDWSLPVQFRFVKRAEAGCLDIEIRSLSLVSVASSVSPQPEGDE